MFFTSDVKQFHQYYETNNHLSPSLTEHKIKWDHNMTLEIQILA